MRLPCGINGKTSAKPTPAYDKPSDFHESDKVRSMMNRLDVEKGRLSGKPGSLFLVIAGIVYREAILPPSCPTFVIGHPS
jgi:hypothetical protein